MHKFDPTGEFHRAESVRFQLAFGVCWVAFVAALVVLGVVL